MGETPFFSPIRIIPDASDGVDIGDPKLSLLCSKGFKVVSDKRELLQKWPRSSEKALCRKLFWGGGGGKIFELKYRIFSYTPSEGMQLGIRECK